MLVLENRLTASPQFGRVAWWQALFTTDLWATAPKSVGPTGYYRPLFLLGLALDGALFADSPMLHRAHSLAWHLLAVGLFWRLLVGLAFSRFATLVGVAWFALHPLQTESVLFVSARNDVMATALLLGCMVWLLVRRERWRAVDLMGSGLCLVAACLAKESALVAPVLWAVIAWTCGGTQLLKRVQPWLSLASGLLLEGVVRWLSGVAMPDSTWPPFELVGKAAAWSARAVVWPFNLSPAVHLAWVDPHPWWALGVVCLGMVGLTVWRRGMAAPLLFALLAWAPTLVAVEQTRLVSLRYLTMPLVGVAMALALAVHIGTKTARTWHRRAALGWTTLLAVACALAVPMWHDDVSLWTAVEQRTPSRYATGALAKVWDDLGDLDKAAQLYEEAAVGPLPFWEACYNVSDVHLRRGDAAAAVQAGERALSEGCRPTPELVAPTALAHALTGNWPRAEALALQVDQDPTGKAVVVRTAASVRSGDLSAFADMSSDDAVGLGNRVVWLLQETGETDAARPLQELITTKR